LVWAGPGQTWSQRHLRWLSAVSLHDPLADVVLGEYLGCHEVLRARRERLDALIAEQAACQPWGTTVARLRCLRGIDTMTAVGLVAEIGDITAFAHPKQLASYVSLVPSEQSTGERRRQGTITKAGSGHARRLLIEAAWHYRRQPRVSLDLRRRHAGQLPATIDAAGARSCVYTAAGRTSTPPAARDAPRSRSPSPENWRASCGRSPASPTELTDNPLEAGWRPTRATRGPRSGLGHQHRLARSILDRGPGTSHSPS
jgi:Transposase IS116/IS110/IS902 family